MSRSLGARTFDGTPNFRCMVVGLTPEQEAACREAVVPLSVVRANDVKEACSSMSTVHPLVVVVDENISDSDRETLVEFTTACGAEIVALERTPVGTGYRTRLFDALLVAERRRMG